MKIQLRKRIATRLRRAMNESSALSSQAALAKRSGVGQTTIGRILRAEVDARTETLEALATTLGKSVAYFTDSKGDTGGNVIRETPLAYTNDAPEKGGCWRVPLISSVRAGVWGSAADKRHASEAETHITTAIHTGPQAFALRVEGDTMTSPTGLSIPEGYIAIIDPDGAYDNGSIVAARLKGDKKVTLKKLVIDGPNRYLKSLNPAYMPIPIDRGCKIVGVATSVLFNL
ncbi:LexA family protein [Microbulbifer sp. 2201CG32-9]|uniref:LexA family protein n=1 Tax=Microbulbifer sp. 2201CG32-9 TaxID=3232309 RepID=UPI00345BBC55